MIGASWRPTATQELLLRATVGDASSAVTAWTDWRNAQDLADIDSGSSRLLPLLMPRAHWFPADDPAWPVIRGCYRRALFHGRMLQARAAEAIRLLDKAGIATLTLKGGALVRYYNNNPALRPMNDLDGLVPRDRAVDAIRLLLANGWTSALPLPELLPDAYHSACFTSRDGLDFDLHWHLVPSSNDAGADDSAWTASVPCDIGGRAIRALGPEDLLTVVCAHAALWSPDAPVRWVADAMRLLQAEGHGFDWKRVGMQARRWHVVPHLAETLRYLRERWHAEVPDALLSQLENAPLNALDRRAYAVLGRMPGTTAYLARPWHRYRLRSRNQGVVAALPGFVRYLKVTLGLTRTRDLPGEIVARVRRWRRDRVFRRR